MTIETSEARDPRQERALEILNAEPTEELLSDRLMELSGDKKLARLAPAVFAHREKIGSLHDFEDLEGAEGLDKSDLARLINGLNRPHFEFETETLELIQWSHGSDLVIESPEAFGTIERRSHGTRISGLRGSIEDVGAAPFGWSWVHMPIASPSFLEGKQFYVRAVLLNFVGWPVPHGLKGAPIAAPYDLEVWDGHRRVADRRMPSLENPTNRYVRVPVESTARLSWGLSVSMNISVRPQVETSPLFTWIDIAAVGVELVTRTGMVVTPI